MWKSILIRLNNTGTLLSLAALVISLLMQFGFDIDSEKVMGIVQTICGILILLGVLNDPTEDTTMYIPYVNDKLMATKEIEESKENHFDDDNDDIYEI